MWYAIPIIVVIFFIYMHKKKRNLLSNEAFTVSVRVNNSDWKKLKKEKEKSLKKLKKTFIKPDDLQTVLNQSNDCAKQFIKNNGYQFNEVINAYNKISFPDDPIKRELVLRKELNKHYKNREETKSKALAIYIAFQHTKLQLSHSDIEWKNTLGLKRLQSNLKAEEYFEHLLNIMFSFLQKFPKLDSTKKLPDDIERVFQLWNSRNYAKKEFENNCIAYEKTTDVSDKHFIIVSIIDYLERRYKFNPQYRTELISWCKKDIELYEQILIQFHEHQIFSIDEKIKFRDDPALKQKILESITLESVKRLKDYFVPRLNSYDTLKSIYESDKNDEQLALLEKIGDKIGYRKDKNNVYATTEVEKPEEVDFSAITQTIEIKKSEKKGKLAFLNSKGDICSTEEAFKDYMEQRDWKVMRAEVSFWQAMFCLSFWEEIFIDMHPPIKGQDIPQDLFNGDDFYLERQFKIDTKYAFIEKQNLKTFINKQIRNYSNNWTRLIYNGDQDMIAYFETDIVQTFLENIEPNIFAKIVYRIAKNPKDNRAGVSDFIIWNEQDLKMVEVKKIREKIRDSQKSWIDWMLKENIPNEVVRVKGIT